MTVKDVLLGIAVYIGVICWFGFGSGMEMSVWSWSVVVLITLPPILIVTYLDFPFRKK